MSDNRIAIVTPSFVRDFALCRTLNRSIIEFFPRDVSHYIVVDQRDLALFRPLVGERTQIISKQDVLPAGIRQLPRLNYWYCNGTLRPVSGWVVQQIAKIAIAALLDEPTLLMVDSDAVFVRDVDTRLFALDGRTRLYKRPGAISASMTSHVIWHNNAARLLGMPEKEVPLDDYIGQVISWSRELVVQMCRHIEAVTHGGWAGAIARTRHVSEYLLYGLYVESAPGSSTKVWIDYNQRCNSRWEMSPLVYEAVDDFIAASSADDVALMINAHSRTDPEIRNLVIKQASRGRLS